jgi:hypothetical protein
MGPQNIRLHGIVLNYLSTGTTSYHEDIRGTGSTAPPFFTSMYIKVNGQLHALAALPL